MTHKAARRGSGYVQRTSPGNSESRGLPVDAGHNGRPPRGYGARENHMGKGGKNLPTSGPEGEDEGDPSHRPQDERWGIFVFLSFGLDPLLVYSLLSFFCLCPSKKTRRIRPLVPV